MTAGTDLSRNSSIDVDLDAASLNSMQESLWRGRWLIVSMASCCAAAALVAAWLTPKNYEATVLLSPVANQASSGGLGALGSAMGQLGSLASLAGLAVPSNGGEKAEAVATLQSEALTERYIRENDLLPILFKKGWDPQRKRWALDAAKIPTLWQGNRRFSTKIRAVRDNPKTGLISLTITWTDATLAAKWANGLVKMTNDYLRESAIAESERDIGYLRGQADKTSVVEMRNAIYSLMESEIKKQMLARGSEEYALKVIDPAVPAETASNPFPLAWAAAGFVGGAFFSIGLLLLRNTFARRSTYPEV